MSLLWKWLWTHIFRPAWQKYVRPWLHIYGRVVGYAAFALALMFGVFWFLQARRMSAMTSNLLTHEREAVPDRFSSLNSLILTKVDAEISDDMQYPSVDVIGIADKIYLRLMGSDAISNSADPSLHIKINNTAAYSSTQQYLFDDETEAALFIPAFVLPVSHQVGQGLSHEELEKILTQYPQLAIDIKASKLIAQYLSEFDKKQLFSNRVDPVVQAYFITTSGVTRMWQYNSTAERTRNNFTAHRFFPDRPYFWPALQHPRQDRKQFSYISRPYFDVAGNGIVTTACWAFTNMKVNDAVLCLDSLHRAPLEDLLQDYRVGPVEIIKCSMHKQDGPHDCPLNLNSSASELHGKLLQKIGELDADHRFDELQGGLYVIEENPSSVLVWLQQHPITGSVKMAAELFKYVSLSDASSKIYFTVPAPDVKTSANEIAFRLYTIDVAKPHRLLLLLAVLTLIFGMIAATCFYVMHRGHVYATRFIDEVVNVMKISPIAFCYVDENDRIQRHNDSFCELTGCNSLQLEGRTLESFLFDEQSHQRYQAVSKSREQMLDTPPYEVRIRGISNQHNNVIISGSPLYFSVSPRQGNLLNRRPHTFGILLRVSSALNHKFVPLYADLERGIADWESLETARPANIPC